MRWAMVAVCALTLVATAPAATYFVDFAGGSDANTGLSSALAWKTIAKVNGATLGAGDSVLFKRGGVWQESLVIPASGGAGNTIKFDAYGSGPAPKITGYLDLPAASWSVDSTNVWKASVTATSMNWVLLGTIWGTKQLAKASLAADRDWFFSANTLYVYAPSTPAAYYSSVAAMLLTGSQLIYANGRSYIDIQHFQLSYFDTYGVRIGGASDHINVANVWAEGIIPNGVLPHGFYVLSTTAPAAINFYNDDAHRNYNGFRFDSTAGITLTNSRGFANRFNGLVDNTANTIYSFCHFYGNNIGVLPSLDVGGGADGGNNIPAYTWAGGVSFQKYPARLTFAVDDIGLKPLAETYVDSLLPVFDQRKLKLSVGVVAGFSGLQIANIQRWLGLGHDMNSHSWSHTYYDDPTLLTVQYTGTGTAATMTVAGDTLTTSVTGGPGGQNLSIDLTNAATNTIHALVLFINGRPGYSATQAATCQDQVHSFTLNGVVGQSITAPYAAQMSKQRFVQDELSASKAWMETNIVGAGNAKTYLWPKGVSDPQTQLWAAAAGYEGARGNLSMALGSNEVYSDGVSLQNVTSFGVTSLHGLTTQQIKDEMAALVFKSAVWGVPYGLFAHKDELTPAEVGAVLDGWAQRGAVILTSTQMVDAIAAMSHEGTTLYYVTAATGREANLRVAAPSPDVGAGTNLGAAYQFDLDGRDRSVFGWDLGAVVANPVTRVSGAGTGSGTAVTQ